jgi:low temperature requirement protein LtrA
MPHQREGIRRLFGSPVLLQDWDSEAEEGAAHYFELFLNLLLVAAASSVADQFKQDENFREFSVFYSIMVNGWMLYTHHITTRFEDKSLAHSMLLFCYLIGFGYSIVNVGFKDVHAFAAGAILQRASVLIMLANIASCLPRARYFCNILAALTVVATVGLCFACWGGETAAVTGLWVAAGVEFCGELILVSFVERRHLVSVNIEHSKERLGALELIMMGETALSVTLTYRELERDDIIHGTQNSYYWVLGLSYMLIFMFTLLFFHLQPAPKEHAFRRSAWHFTLLLLAHKLLGLALLAVGVSVKMVVEAVLL